MNVRGVNWDGKIPYFLFLLSSTTGRGIFQRIYLNEKEVKLASAGPITYPYGLEFYIRPLVISSVKIGLNDQKKLDIIIIAKQINNSWKTYT